MAANIEIDFDDSALGRVYAWLLTQKDETLNIDVVDEGRKSETGATVNAQIHGSELELNAS